MILILINFIQYLLNLIHTSWKAAIHEGHYGFKTVFLHQTKLFVSRMKYNMLTVVNLVLYYKWKTHIPADLNL